MPPLALYIHWPFCLSKCPYCDFNSHVGGGQDQEIWRQAYRRELTHNAALLPSRRITSVFFGGGTPSLMEARTVESVLNDIARLWACDDKIEITLEANPSSAEAEKFADFRRAGVQRLSLGVQSLNDAALRFLGRAHNAQEARAALALAARSFPRFSFDLIYARKGQTPDDWRAELQEALSFGSDHLSLYQLTIEAETVFATRARRGESLTAPEEASVLMYEMTQEMMEKAGLPAYEISNHARLGQESRHNLTYWHYEDYVGIGPGAHGRIGIGTESCQAIENHRAPETWLDSVQRTGVGMKQRTDLSPDAAMREALMMGLRLTEGIDLQRWREKFGCDLMGFVPEARRQRLEAEAYLKRTAERLFLTRAGLQRLNSVLGYLA